MPDFVRQAPVRIELYHPEVPRERGYRVAEADHDEPCDAYAIAVACML